MHGHNPFKILVLLVLWTRSNPTQPDPTDGSAQLKDNSGVAWYDVLRLSLSLSLSLSVRESSNPGARFSFRRHFQFMYLEQAINAQFTPSHQTRRNSPVCVVSGVAV